MRGTSLFPVLALTWPLLVMGAAAAQPSGTDRQSLQRQDPSDAGAPARPARGSARAPGAGAGSDAAQSPQTGGEARAKKRRGGGGGGLEIEPNRPFNFGRRL